MDMRDYTNIEKYLNELEQDIYEQSSDEWHTKMAKEVIDDWIPKLDKCESVLDVGCGSGFCMSMFEDFGIDYFGITLGEDFKKYPFESDKIFSCDFSFVCWDDNAIDLIFSRHSLEHSPMPLLTLMEWHRVAKKYLCLIMPKPEAFGFGGRNHYSVLTIEQIKFLLDRSGWEIMWQNHKTPEEYRFMCKKVPRVFNPEIINYKPEEQCDRITK